MPLGTLMPLCLHKVASRWVHITFSSKNVRKDCMDNFIKMRNVVKMKNNVYKFLNMKKFMLW